MTNEPLPKISNPLGGRNLALKGVPLAMLLVASGTGCYRATGSSRPTVVAEEIPASGGDRVPGNKSTAGPGDFYLGSDNFHLTVDGAVFGERKGQFGAPSGGAILDIGSIALDQSFKRVPLPTDNVDRIGLVVNQDPDLPLVFDHYSATSLTDGSELSMTGYLLDRKHKLAGASWDSSGRVLGVSVEHSITLQGTQLFVELSTTVRYAGAGSLPVRNIADFLTQRGGGFRFIVPGVSDAAGQTLPQPWGLEIPGSDFTQGLATSVQAPAVALVGAEPSAADMDIHQSLGFMPLDAPNLLVASDPQPAFEEDRARFPHQLAVGSLPSTSLDAANPLVFNRRLYVVGGQSRSNFEPVRSTGLFNVMAGARAALDGSSLGSVFYSTSGSAVLKGPRQSEVRFERYLGALADPSTDNDPTHWMLERVELRESGENSLPLGASPLSPTGLVLPVVDDPNHAGQTQSYRITTSNRDGAETDYRFVDLVSTTAVGLPVLLQPQKNTAFVIGESLYPERSLVSTGGGATTSRSYYVHLFSTRLVGDQVTQAKTYLPQRLVFAAVDGAGVFTPSLDPDVQRLRYLAGSYDPYFKEKIVGIDGGRYQFTAGNQVFGSGFVNGDSDGVFYFKPGTYQALGTRGPLGPLTRLGFTVEPGAQEIRHSLVIPNVTLPSGWTSFDVPGASQMTTGGMLPAEQLSSAMAEGVQVVVRAEEDKLVDASGEATSFLTEFDQNSSVRRAAIDGQLFAISGRRSELAEGTATSLFTTAPDAFHAFGGAASSEGWSLADFIARAEGKFTIVHRPRGPQGLFTRKGGIAPGVPLGTGANAWWTASDDRSQGKRTGDFDAIELLRAEGCDSNDPSAWFAEFKTLRQDWFNLLNLQSPTAFTKGLGLSSGVYSLDTPVGLARTYLKTGATVLSQADLSPVLGILRSGAAVASTGPLLDVVLVDPATPSSQAGPGSLLPGPVVSPTLNISLYAPTWVPVQEVRIVVNGVVVQTLDPSTFAPSATDSRLRTVQVPLDLAALAGGKDAWVVVEAGVPLSTSGAYAVGTPWNKVMKGIYPVAVTNPIFVDANGGGYTPPLP